MLRPDGPAGSPKTAIKPWRKERWCRPPEADAEFVCVREEGLEVSHRPSDETRPRVCLDEASQPRVGEGSEPIPAEPGPPERFDDESTRHGTAPLFRVSRPLLGGRAVKVTQPRTAVDFAEVIRGLVEEVPEAAEKVVLVLDNLNTPKLASWSEACPPERARRMAEPWELHPTPKQGSWLNVAEIELSVLARPGRDRRLETSEEWEREVAAGEEQRNERGVEVRWQFTTADARIKPRRLYPTI